MNAIALFGTTNQGDLATSRALSIPYYDKGLKLHIIVPARLHSEFLSKHAAVAESFKSSKRVELNNLALWTSGSETRCSHPTMCCGDP